MSDWSSDVCSSDLNIEYRARNRAQDEQCAHSPRHDPQPGKAKRQYHHLPEESRRKGGNQIDRQLHRDDIEAPHQVDEDDRNPVGCGKTSRRCRSEEHTSELQSLMRISYAVFCLKKKNIPTHKPTTTHLTLTTTSHKYITTLD